MRVRIVTRDIGALKDDLLIPGQSQPLEPLEDRASALVGAARAVGILDSQQKDAVVFAHVQPVEERGAGTANMEKAGRTRSKTNAWFHRFKFPKQNCRCASR